MVPLCPLSYHPPPTQLRGSGEADPTHQEHRPQPIGARHILVIQTAQEWARDPLNRYQQKRSQESNSIDKKARAWLPYPKS